MPTCGTPPSRSLRYRFRSEPPDPKIAIVGAGHRGLTAAAILHCDDTTPRSWNGRMLSKKSAPESQSARTQDGVHAT